MYYKKQLEKAKYELTQIDTNIEVLILFNSRKITDKIKNRWVIGRGVNGGIIGKYSNSKIGREYQAFKVSKNPQANGSVDLILTGSLSEKLFITTNGEIFEIKSKDYKFQDIGKKYGFNQFNLTFAETQLLIQELYLEVMREYTENVWQKV